MCCMRLLIDKGNHIKFDENQNIPCEPMIDKLYFNLYFSLRVVIFYVAISLELALDLFKITLMNMIT